MAQPNIHNQDEIEQPLLYHLIELRQRLVRSVVAVIAVFLPLFFIRNQLHDFLVKPLMDNLPAGSSVIATEVAASFLVPTKIAMVMAFFIAQPYVLYQVWSFVAPGLYRHERNIAIPLMFSAAILFYTGMAFSYFVVMPAAFWFFVQTAPDSLQMFTDTSHYFNFVLKIFFAFGVTFEIPVATFLLIRSGAVTVEALTQKRPFIIVGAFVIAMMLTPPDPMSQIALAVPMLLLFELGVLAGRMYGRPQESEYEQQDEYEQQETAAQTAGETGITPSENLYEDPYHDEGDYRPMSDEEMDAELDRMEEEDETEDSAGDGQDKPDAQATGEEPEDDKPKS